MKYWEIWMNSIWNVFCHSAQRHTCLQKKKKKTLTKLQTYPNVTFLVIWKKRLKVYKDFNKRKRGITPTALQGIWTKTAYDVFTVGGGIALQVDSHV